MTPRVALVVVAVVAAVVLTSDTGPDPARTLCRVAPPLQLDVASHVVHDDDASFLTFCAEVGTLRLRHSILSLQEALEQERFEDYRRVSALVLPRIERLAHGLCVAFEDSGSIRDARFRRSLDPARGHALHRALRELRSLLGPPELDPGEALKRRRDLAERFRAMGYARGVLMAEHHFAGDLLKLGRYEESYRVGCSTLEQARRLGETTLTCQILGELGYRQSVNGARDSARAMYGEAYRLAMRYKLPEQAGRLLEFESNRHAREGRFALATEYAIRAQRVCRDLKGCGFEVRFVVAAMKRFAELGSWDAVEQQLVRCPALLRQFQDLPRFGMGYAQVVEEYRGRALMARGELDSARAVFQALRGPTYAQRAWAGTYGMLYNWADAMLDAGAAADALPVIEDAIAYCDSMRSFEVTPHLTLMRAQALLELGRPEEAVEAMKDYEARRAGTRLATSTEVPLVRQIMLARVAAGVGDGAARSAAANAWRLLWSYARALDAGPQAYLALEERRDLRRLLHERRSTTAAHGYGLDLAWRAVPAQLGRTAGAHAPAPEVEATSWVGRGLPAAGEIHVVYFTLPEFILRWTATQQGIARDTLLIPLARCEADQRRLASLLNASSRPESDTSELADQLRQMADDLLPDDASQASRLYVSADGPLSAVPFEALNVAPPGAYRALALTTDVAAVRSGVPVASRRRATDAVVVADPDVGLELTRRYPSLRPRGAGSREIEIVRRQWPEARLLTGSRATKQAVLGAFTTASRIHVAAHVGRVPEVPFLTFVPLALPPGAEESESMLEVKDIRSLDLSGCELVILSACGSGAPYVSGGRVAPSLGDAFLDSGARAVIHTRRDVSDDEAVAFTERLLPALEREQSLVAAVNQCRRDAIAHAEQESDPTAWATWTVGLRTAPWANGARPRLTSADSHSTTSSRSSPISLRSK